MGWSLTKPRFLMSRIPRKRSPPVLFISFERVLHFDIKMLNKFTKIHPIEIIQVIYIKQQVYITIWDN